MIKKNVRSNSVMSIEISPDEIKEMKLIYLKGSNMVNWYNKQIIKPRFMINTSLFSYKNYIPIGTVKINGVWVNNAGMGWGLGIYNTNDFKFSAPWDMAYTHYYTGYPALIKNGVNQSIDTSNSVLRNYAKRSLVGVKADGNLHLIDISSCTALQAQSKLKKLGFVNVINNDGGGSSLILEYGKPINNPTEDDRGISCCLAIYTKSSTYSSSDSSSTGSTTTSSSTNSGIINNKPTTSGGITNEEEKEMTYKVKCLTRTYVYDEDGNLKSGYIACNDICTIYSNLNYSLLAKIIYPVSNGTKTAYIKDIKNFKMV